MSPATAGAPVRIGVLGCASIAWQRVLPALRTAPEFTLVAVASRDREKARTFAERFDTEPVHGYDGLLEREDIDAVYVPLPTGMHYEWVRRALRAGKHTLAEKPLATTLAHATELVELAAASGLVLRENFMFLHHGQHRAIQRLVASGTIGQLRNVTAAFGIPPRPDHDIRYSPELGGGALLDVGVYPIRAASLFLGEDIRVAGAVLGVDPASGVDIAGTVLLRDGAGATATLAFGFAHHYRGAYELWGSAGRIVVDRAFTPPADWTPVVRVESPDRVDDLRLPAEDQVRAAVVAFARAIRSTDDGVAGLVGGAAILRQAALVDAVRDATG